MNATKLGTALITGASSGLGAIYADRLARRGYDLVLVARNETRLDQLAKRLVTETGRDVRTVVADLEKAEDLRRVEDLIRDEQGLTMLINNAGVGSAAPLLQANVDKMESMIDLNITALTRLTYAAGPAFVARGGGTIVNIASAVAIAPEFLNGVYGASKAFVLALSQSLKHELADKGVRVQVVLPGATRTEFWDAAGTPVDSLPAEMIMSADNLVDAALAGLDQGEFATVPSLPTVDGWNAFEAARAALVPQVSLAKPGARYNVQ
ncbi:SDR family oxidoreductase [Paraburkholderia sp. C35]|uniref:SDR family NAD(P)-dependent oxidoreductase n=1 Tax=Paraburkholderia sp. C35 TaxID=2126993 RepID=UPI000D690768|nr:SDR family oxidoreductase [Paraburkholderia sp. C35]